MIYLAVLFILVGVLIILIALFSNIQRRPLYVTGDSPSFEKSRRQEVSSPEETSMPQPEQLKEKNYEAPPTTPPTENFVETPPLRERATKEDNMTVESFVKEKVPPGKNFTGEHNIPEGSASQSSLNFSQQVQPKETPPAHMPKVVEETLLIEQPHAREDVFLSFEEGRTFSNEEVQVSESAIQQSSGEVKFVDEELPTVHLPDETPDETIIENEIAPKGDVLESELKTFDAILFDDASGVIDYESGEAIIDPTSQGYNKISRVGRGVIMPDDDGVTFNMNGEIFRFDFRRLYNLWSGNNYVALPMDNSSSVKLFIFDGFGNPEKILEKSFAEFKKG